MERQFFDGSIFKMMEIQGKNSRKNLLRMWKGTLNKSPRTVFAAHFELKDSKEEAITSIKRVMDLVFKTLWNSYVWYGLHIIT